MNLYEAYVILEQAKSVVSQTKLELEAVRKVYKLSLYEQETERITHSIYHSIEQLQAFINQTIYECHVTVKKVKKV